jgi:hypothetical protein
MKGSKQALLFVNKKKQKNFGCRTWGFGANTAHGPKDKKFFGSFFQKRTTSFSFGIRT